MKYHFLIIISLITALNARYSISKYDSLFIQASASFHNHQVYVEPARQKIIDIGEDIIPFLAEKSSSRQPREYHALRNLFSRIDPKLSSRYLMDVIRLEDRESFGTAVEFLGLSKYDGGLDFLQNFLSSDSSWVKVAALKGIGDLKDPKSLHVVRHFMNDDDFRVRWQVAAALGKMDTSDGDRMLVSMLKDSLQLVSHTALRYLDLHLTADSLKERHRVLKSISGSPLLELLRSKHIDGEIADLISEGYGELGDADSTRLMTMADLISDDSVIYSALEKLYMSKRDFFLPVRTEKEVFLFPSVAEMFKDPLLQAALPVETVKDYDNFPHIDFKSLAYEFSISVPSSDPGRVDIERFIKDHSYIEAVFDSAWHKYSDKDKIIGEVKSRFFGERETEYGLPDDDISVMVRNRLDERRYYDESKKFYKETLKDFEPAYIVKAGIMSYMNFLALVEFVKENELEPFEKDTPFGRVRVGGKGDDVYEGSYFLIIDQGGNDTYRLNNKDQRFSYIIDLEGNDRYISEKFGPASAFNGISFLYDGKGDDIYDAKDYSLASSLFGFSILLDGGGNDRFISNTHSQAAATFGYSCLWNAGGNDVYIAEMKSQSYAGVHGYAVLVEDEGNDNYTLSGNQVDVLRYSDHFMSMGQGYSFGDRDHAAGGIAMLFDKQGNDNYISDIFGQGGGYWLAFGALYDLAGNDNYISYQYSMGSGVHLAFGTLIDLEGDDSYKSKGVSMGCGHDYAGGMFFDLSGNDSYHAESLSIGASSANGISVFFDGEGNDLYSAHQPNTIGWSDWRRDAGYISIFIDLGGNNRYASPAGANGRKWYRGTWGIGLDFDYKIGK